MSNLKTLTVDVTAVDIGTPERLNVTPLQGGQGREAMYHVPVLPLTSVFKLQGHDSPEADAPAENDAGWYDLATIDKDSEKMGEIRLPAWIRWNTTTLDADGPDVLVYLEGVQ